MTLRSVFRALVLGEWIVLVAATFGVYDRFFRPDAPTETVDVGPWIAIFSVFAVVQTVTWAIASIGLWKFRNWARILYVGVQVSSVVVGWVAPLLTPKVPSQSVEPFPTGPLNWLQGPIVGAIIALAWGSAVAKEFRKPPTAGTPLIQPSADAATAEPSS